MKLYCIERRAVHADNAAIIFNFTRTIIYETKHKQQIRMNEWASEGTKKEPAEYNKSAIRRKSRWHLQKNHT